MKKEEKMLKMRDGIRLQSLIYYPDENGSYPTILARCTYGTASMEPRAKYWTDKGFVVILQNIRGRNKSEGGPIEKGNTPEDGYDTIDWIISQDWSNKKVGTFGASANAKVQIATATLLHPAHLAMAPRVLPYGRNTRLGGIFMFSQLSQWMYMTLSGNKFTPYNTIDWMPNLYKLPISSTLDDIGGPIEEYREVILNFDEYFVDDAGYQFEKLSVPNLMVTGWHDHCLSGTIDFFVNTMEEGTEKQKENTHLVIGPWDHTAVGDAGKEYDFGSDALLDLNAMENEFFEKHLKGNESKKSLPTVKIFTMGRNEWREETEWPLSKTVETKFYLHSKGDVKGAWNKGLLSTVEPKDENPDKFIYDPANPVPTIGGANSMPAISLPMKRGAKNQQTTLYRDDVLVYYGEILEEPLEVTGFLKCVLYASSSAIDTDFTGKLMDIGLDGNARILSDGIIRARYRNGRYKPEMIVPNKVYKYEIDLWSTSNDFQKGHRIGFAISSSNFPRFDRNLNTGGNPDESEFIKAEQTIYHNDEYPSHLVLPIIE